MGDKMEFTLITRPVTPTDTGPDCPFVPSNEDIEIHLDALVEDIEGLPFVESATRDAFVLTITLNQSRDPSDLKNAMEPFFRNCFKQVRFNSLSAN